MISRLRNFFGRTLFPEGIQVGHLLLGAVLFVIFTFLIFAWFRKEGPIPILKNSQEKRDSQTIPDEPSEATSDPHSTIRPQEHTTESRLPGSMVAKPIDLRENDASAIPDKNGIEILKPGISEAERSELIDELTQMDPDTIIDTVMEVLDSPDPEVREDILDALKDIDDDAVNAPLLKAMEDENPDVVEKAMDVMDDIHSASVLPSLRRAISDNDENIRGEALNILEDIPDPRAIDILIEWGLHSDSLTTREDALDALELIFPDQDFESSDDFIRWWAQNRDIHVFEE